MHSTPEEIKAALDAYRSHVAARNRQALEVYVPVIARAEVEPGDLENDDDIVGLRMDSVRQLVGAEEEDFVELGIDVPGDVLEKYEALVPLVGLDGVSAPSGPEQDEERRARGEEYFTAVEDALREKSLEEVRDEITVPGELRQLATFVDGIHAPGLDHERMGSLWAGVRESPAAAARRVKPAEEMKTSSGLDWRWEVAGGWEWGDAAEEGPFCVVYCRRADDDDKKEEWAWRYTFLSFYDYSTWVFDTIPELLAWYRDFGVEDKLPTEEDLDVDRLLDGMF
ncbi:hypothetical protein CPLU01_03136 [Colletotrichum plurivorum]|uniref:Uncharacterized protein n=1 Tax=Colletotrichum plurivorum TaxID=2175906 RepID=A0A8H6NKS6_9PEZI|nr:hypothetical protein CPLU01_03136 [Colletotrichum plurivorum]